MTHTDITPHFPADDKPEIDYVEEKIEAKDTPVRSQYANLTPHEARRKFLRLYLFTLSLCVGGMYTGYAVVAPGNVVANPGFIEVGA